MGRDQVTRTADDILGAANLLDWLEGALRGLWYGDIAPHRLTLPHPDSEWWEEHPDVEPWNLNDMRRLLGKYHITTYGRGFNGDYIWTHVKRKQARWAEYILLRAGCPLVNTETVDPRNPVWAARHNGPPPRWDDRKRDRQRRQRRRRA